MQQLKNPYLGYCGQMLSCVLEHLCMWYTIFHWEKVEVRKQFMVP